MKTTVFRILIISSCLLSGCGKSIRTTYTPIYAVLVGLTTGPQKEDVIVEETTYFHQATGFLLNRTGLVVTNYHALIRYPNIRVYFVTPDEDGTLTSREPVKKGRAIVEVDLDGSYLLTDETIEESEKVKLFEHFIDDLKQLIDN